MGEKSSNKIPGWKKNQKILGRNQHQPTTQRSFSLGNVLDIKKKMSTPKKQPTTNQPHSPGSPGIVGRLGLGHKDFCLPSRERITYPAKREKGKIIDSNMILFMGFLLGFPGGYVFCMGRGVNQNRSRPVTERGPHTKYMFHLCSYNNVSSGWQEWQIKNARDLCGQADSSHRSGESRWPLVHNTCITEALVSVWLHARGFFRGIVC